MENSDSVETPYLGVQETGSSSKSLATAKLSEVDVLGYVRELRNGIVHRGVDPTCAGSVVNGIVRAIAPPLVGDYRGRLKYVAPKPLLIDIFVHCESGTKPIVERFLEPVLARLSAVSPAVRFAQGVDSIKEAEHIQGWAKKLANEMLEPGMFEQVWADKLKRLRKLLKPMVGHQPIEW